MNIREKLANIEQIILKTEFLLKLISLSGKKYNIDDLVNLGYVSVIKKGSVYFNNQILAFRDPYILGGAYMDFKNFMFGGFDMYNKKGFITQVSNIFTIYNLNYSRELEIMGIKFKFKKIKKGFFYGKETKMINGYNINYMTRERLFLEYVRDYMTYEDNFFIEIYKTLDIKLLEKYMQKYPIKKVIDKINKIKVCL
ncbi:hypothetical protein EOM39_05075 [Candidatus Gracilibacteria bacterium]|nr:hypothetical protein [Candidatus Gracilibacteria bacterium]